MLIAIDRYKKWGIFRQTQVVINCKFTHQQIFNQNPYFLEFVKVQLSSLVILVIVKDYYSAQPDQFTLITITVVINIPHSFGQFYSPFIYYIMLQFLQRTNHCHHYHDHHPNSLIKRGGGGEGGGKKRLVYHKQPN